MKRWTCSKWLTLLAMTASCLLLFSATALAQDEANADRSAEPGVLIVEVDPGSPAATAGLKRGDILLRVGDEEVNDVTALRNAMGDLAPAAAVTLTILHGDDEREVEVTLVERNGQAFLGVVPYGQPAFGVAPMRPTMPNAQPFERIPLPPMPPTDDVAGTEGMIVTLVVVDVVDESPAADAGLQPDDVISAVDGEALTAPDALVNRVQELAPGDSITLTIQRADSDAQTEEVVVTLGAHPDDAEQAYLGIRLAPMIRIERTERSFGPGDRPLRRFQFRGPRFLAPGDQGQEECQCRPQLRRRWFFMPGNGTDERNEEQNFIMPAPNQFFWLEGVPVEEDVIFFHNDPGHFDIPVGPLWMERGDEFALPEFDRSTMPTEPAPLEIEIVETLI